MNLLQELKRITNVPESGKYFKHKKSGDLIEIDAMQEGQDLKDYTIVNIVAEDANHTIVKNLLNKEFEKTKEFEAGGKKRTKPNTLFKDENPFEYVMKLLIALSDYTSTITKEKIFAKLGYELRPIERESSKRTRKKKDQEQ